MKPSREVLAACLLLLLGLGPRLYFIHAFPTIPVSDFNSLVAFGQQLRDHGLTSDGWPWQFFSAGLPLVLCGLFHLFPKTDPAAVARIATACACGLLPLLPFFLWRGVLSLRMRFLTGAALALWPGQILFSGVVAQDNWVLLPSVALGALAVRALLAPKRTWPVAASLLYAAGVGFRQEMLVALFPLWVAAVLPEFRLRWRRLAAASVAVLLPLVALAAYRYRATGRFALGTEHSGVSILGSYIPGATANAWIDPYPFIASVRPDLLLDRKALLAEATHLAVREALRRPVFQMARILSLAANFALTGDAVNLYWSLGSDSLTPDRRERGEALIQMLIPPLDGELALIQALFVAALIIAIRRRHLAILALAAAVLLKYALHAVTVSQGRYFLAATALEILAIALALGEVRALTRRHSLEAFGAGLVFGLALLQFAPRMEAFVKSRDTDGQRTYRFPLQTEDHAAALSCTIDRGLLGAFEWPAASASLRTLARDPAPGDEADAVCEVTGKGEPRPLRLEILDGYPHGGLGGRMMQRVELNGVDVFSHDIAADPGSGWSGIPLGNVGAGTRKKLVIVVKALRPDPGAAWGEAAQTKFRISRPPFPAIAGAPGQDLAAGKAATQSSTLAEYPAAAAALAVDQNADGNFYHGSVTHTRPEENPWWQVDLGASAAIAKIVLWNRTDCCGERLGDYWLFISDEPFSPADTPASLRRRPRTWSSHQTDAPRPSESIDAATKGRYVRVQMAGANPLSLAEVQVIAAPAL